MKTQTPTDLLKMAGALVSDAKEAQAKGFESAAARAFALAAGMRITLNLLGLTDFVAPGDTITLEAIRESLETGRYEKG